MAAPLHRLSFEPVDRYLAVRYAADLTPACPNGWYDYPPEAERSEARFLGPQQVARLLGPIPGHRSRSGAVTDRTIDRWRAAGVSVWLADRIATALGLPPDDCQLWGQTWADAVDDTIDRWVRSGPRSPEPPPPSKTPRVTPKRKVAA